MISANLQGFQTEQLLTCGMPTEQDVPSELRLNISSPDIGAKNLRSKKGSEASNDLTEDNLKQIMLLITSLTDKIDKLDADS